VGVGDGLRPCDSAGARVLVPTAAPPRRPSVAPNLATPAGRSPAAACVPVRLDLCAQQREQQRAGFPAAAAMEVEDGEVVHLPPGGQL